MCISSTDEQDRYDKQLEQVCKSIQCYNVLVLCLKCLFIVYIDITRVLVKVTLILK